MSGIKAAAEGLVAEFKRLLPGQRKTQRDNLALLVATMLDARSANLMDLAAALPREADRTDMRYQWIARVLGNGLIDPDAVMAPFAREVLARAASDGRVVLILDQSKLSDRHQVLMLALRHGERALPLAWRVQATAGPIGFEVQKELLEAAVPWAPEGAEVCLMADRFYGTADLISLCQGQGWGYRLRLKGSLAAYDRSGKATTAVRAKARDCYLRDVELTARRARTNIGVIHDPGHDEPWIVAMSDKPGYLTTLDYCQRWGIEPMFSDFKSRGFGVEHTQIQYPDRLARLLLVMALALYSAVSTGLWDAAVHLTPPKKLLMHSQTGRPKRQPRNVARSKLSSFTRGLRRIARLMQAALPLPPLWQTWEVIGAKLDFGHSGGMAEGVGDAFAECRAEFCRLGRVP